MKSNMSDFIDESIAVCCPPPPGDIVSQRTEKSSRLSSSVAQSSVGVPAISTHFLSPYALACSSVTQSSVVDQLSEEPMQEKSPSPSVVRMVPSSVETNSPSTISTLTQYPTKDSLLPPSAMMLGGACCQENATDLVAPPPALHVREASTEAKGEQEGDALSAVPVVDVAPPEPQQQVGAVGCDPANLTRGQLVPVLLEDVGIQGTTPKPIQDKEQVDDGHAGGGRLVGGDSTPAVVPAVVKEAKKRGRRQRAKECKRLKKSTRTKAGRGNHLVRTNKFGKVEMFPVLSKEMYLTGFYDGLMNKSRW